jgi:hypothetical protein
MRGKYSPTVTAAYMKDQKWWHKFSREAEAWTLYDPEGFDSYGYGEDGKDRAGNDEFDYMHNDLLDEDFSTNDDCNWKYDSTIEAWGFDGVKPVRK